MRKNRGQAYLKMLPIKCAYNSCVFNTYGGCPRFVIVKAMDYGIVVSEFEFQSLYNVHFQANTPGKSMNPIILPAMG